MLRHVVMFEWNDGIDDDAVAAIGSALDAFVAGVPEVADYRHGPDLGFADGNHDYVVVAEFASHDDFVVYRDHPEHQRIIAELIRPNLAARAAVQYDAT